MGRGFLERQATARCPFYGRLATNRMKEVQKLEKATKLARKADHDMGWFENSLHPKSDRTKVHRQHVWFHLNTQRFFRGFAKVLANSFPRASDHLHVAGERGSCRIHSQDDRICSICFWRKRWGKILTQPYSSEKS